MRLHTTTQTIRSVRLILRRSHFAVSHSQPIPPRRQDRRRILFFSFWFPPLGFVVSLCGHRSALNDRREVRWSCLGGYIRQIFFPLYLLLWRFFPYSSSCYRKRAPTRHRGPPSLVRPAGFVPAAPSLANKGGDLRARPPTGRYTKSPRRGIRAGYSFVLDALIKA